MRSHRRPPQRRAPKPAVHRAQGWSALQALVVVSLSLALATLASVHLRDVVQLRRLQSASADWSRVVLAARQMVFNHQQVAWLEVLQVGQEACLVLHTGNRGDCRGCGDAMACQPPARVLAHSQALAPGLQASASSTSLAWSPRERTVTPTGTLRLTLADGRAIHHVVNLVGRLRVCSPDGLVGGVTPC